ncbi:hypothetical protein TRVL_10000 [Trypanosoma vivax]|nr:hypothetical protein TRVL_10000 [Trypanosoma vivax]
MLKLPVIFLLVCWLSFSAKRKATAQQAEQQDANNLKECDDDKNIKVSFNLTEIRDKATYDFGCLEYKFGAWVYLHMGGSKVELEGYQVGCYAEDEEVEVRCAGKQATTVQARSLPKKACTLHKRDTRQWFDAFVKKNGTVRCKVWKNETEHHFSFSVFGVSAAGSPSATSGATVPGGQTQAVHTDPDDSVPVQGAHLGPNNALTSGGREGVAITPPGSTGSSGAHSDGLANDPAVSSTQTSPNEAGREKASGERDKNGDLEKQTSSYSPLARIYYLVLFSLFSQPALL